MMLEDESFIWMRFPRDSVIWLSTDVTLIDQIRKYIK